MTSWAFVLAVSLYSGVGIEQVGPFPSKTICEQQRRVIAEDLLKFNKLHIRPVIVTSLCYEVIEETKP